MLFYYLLVKKKYPFDVQYTWSLTITIHYNTLR